MGEGSNVYQSLFAELSDYENCGIPIKVGGFQTSPMQVITAHMVKEENTTYMRDYVLDDSGKVKELCFYHIEKN